MKKDNYTKTIIFKFSNTAIPNIKLLKKLQFYCIPELQVKICLLIQNSVHLCSVELNPN